MKKQSSGIESFMDKSLLYEKIYNSEIYKTLEEYKSKNGSNVLWDGHNGTLCNENRENEFQYVLWIVNTLKSIKNDNITILETGTNYGSFSHICYCIFKNFKLYTNDVVYDSKLAIDKINNFYNNNSVIFNQGDISDINLNGISFDVTWLDSGHNFNILYNELKECDKYNVKNILVDDTFNSAEVTKAVGKFLYESPKYRIKECTTFESSQLAGLQLQLKNTENFR